MPKSHDIVISVLQNGREVCARRYPYGTPRKIALSNHNVKKLYIDSYGIAHDLPVLSSSKKGVRILDIGKMSGYIVAGNQHMRLTHALKDQTFYLQPGDAASLSKNDLRILVKVAPKLAKTKRLRTDGGKIPFFAMWIGSSLNGKILAFATLLAIIMSGGFIAGLLDKADLRPKKLHQLSREYLMPFIHEDHFHTLPEAMQGRLDRRQPVHQLLTHYQAMTHLLLGFELGEGEYLYPATVREYRRKYIARNQALGKIEDANTAAIDARLARLRWAGALSVPVVRGEAFVPALRRSIDSLRHYHLSLNVNYAFRKKFLAEAQQLKHYDYQKYKDFSANPFAKPRNVTGEPQGEELRMYRDYNKLGQAARGMHLALKKVRTWEERDTVLQNQPVMISTKASELLFRQPGSAEPFDKKNLVISASAFDPRMALTATGSKKLSAKRLLLRGTVDRKKLRRAVRRHRFQLQICYEAALRKNFRLKGQMEWEWVLDTKGAVSRLALVASDIKDRQMIRCVKARIAKWQLPRAKNGKVKIRFPFTFDRAKG